MKYYDDIADVARRSGDELLGGACFVAGTKIVTEDEYKSIEDIKVGDKVLSQDVDTGEKVLLSSGKISIISKVSKEKLKEAVKVYNFEVSDWHTYFVSNIGVLVHNDCMAKFKGMGKATKNNYRKLFLEKFPDLPEGYQVHHKLPQKYESILKEGGINIHEVDYLKGVDSKIHSKITTEWTKWDKSLGKTPTAQDVIDFAKEIDTKYNKYWFNK